MAERATPETQMNHRRLINDAWTYDVNIRAEDGPQPSRGWRALLDNLLIPLGFILALILLSILMGHSALAQTGSGRITGSVKDASGALISGSSVSLINTATGVTQKTTSNGGLTTDPQHPLAGIQVGPLECQFLRPNTGYGNQSDGGACRSSPKPER
jgi:hypothetical protein